MPSFGLDFILGLTIVIPSHWALNGPLLGFSCTEAHQLQSGGSSLVASLYLLAPPFALHVPSCIYLYLKSSLLAAHFMTS